MGLGYGPYIGMLDEPLGSVVAGGKLFIADSNNNRVSVHYMDGSFCKTIGSELVEDGELKTPRGLEVHNTNLFVSDGAEDRVCVYNIENGTFVRYIGYGQGSDDGQLNGVSGLAVSGDHLFITDTKNHRVSVFGVEGTFMRIIGSDEHLNHPVDVAIWKDLVYVTNANHRVSVFKVDGTFVQMFAHREFETPCGIAVAGNRVFVVDQGNSRVSVHHLDGTFVRSFGSPGSENGQFYDAWGIAFAEDRLYVTDGNHRVQVFS
jgi:tripartite motif-containing protein 71